jgi:hypothetical protein
MESVIFMFCLTLHNIEEALWLTEWRIKTIPDSRRSPEKEHFIFAVLGITVSGYLVAGLFALYPNNQYFEYAFIGFVGAMLVNAIVPHILLTIKYKKYCPGVFTGCLLIIPFHIIILCNAANDHSVSKIIIATVVVGIVLLAAIPFFETLAKKFFDNTI